MDWTLLAIIFLFLIVIYLEYGRIKLRNIVLEMEFALEELHKKIEEHEGIINEKKNKKS